MTAKLQSVMQEIVAALGLFLIRANSPKDYPVFSVTTSINKGN